MLTVIKGEAIRLSVVFTDGSGTPIVVSAVTLKIRRPDRTVTDIASLSIIPNGTGAYYADYITPLAGAYSAQWACGGAAPALGEISFLARASNVTL